MNEVNFVELSPKDTEKAAELEELARVIWTEHYTPIIGVEQVEYMLSKFQSAEGILNDICSNSYSYFVAYDGREPVGYFAIKPEQDKKVLLLSKLYLEKGHRGQGISRIMLEKIQHIAREEGRSHIILFVNKHNSSVKVYKKLGFEIVEQLVTDIGNGYVMDDYKMLLAVQN